MPFVELDAATRVHYLVEGERGPAPDLVLVHGTGGDAVTNWGHLMDPLGAGRRRVIAVDYSGSGRTTDDGTPLTLSGLAAQVRAVIDDVVGDGPFDLMGFSLGACIAAQVAADAAAPGPGATPSTAADAAGPAPDATPSMATGGSGAAGGEAAGLRRLVLLSGWLDGPSDPRFALQFGLWRHLHATDRRALAEHLALTGFSPGYLAGRPAKATEQAIANTLATLAPGFERQCELDPLVDLTAAAPRIGVPTLVLVSTDDQMVPPAHGRALAAAISGATVGELPSGHLSLYEVPALVTERVLAFLD